MKQQADKERRKIEEWKKGNKVMLSIKVVSTNVSQVV